MSSARIAPREPMHLHRNFHNHRNVKVLITSLSSSNWSKGSVIRTLHWGQVGYSTPWHHLTHPPTLIMGVNKSSILHFWLGATWHDRGLYLDSPIWPADISRKLSDIQLINLIRVQVGLLLLHLLPPLLQLGEARDLLAQLLPPSHLHLLQSSFTWLPRFRESVHPLLQLLWQRSKRNLLFHQRPASQVLKIFVTKLDDTKELSKLAEWALGKVPARQRFHPQFHRKEDNQGRETPGTWGFV